MLARILLVEDHPQLRQVLRRFIEYDAELEVIGTAGSAEEALKLLDRLSPDLLLVDMSLPGKNGLALIRQVKQRLPGLRCVVLSAHEREVHHRAANVAGADAYVTKFRPEHLIPTIREVLSS